MASMTAKKITIVAIISSIILLLGLLFIFFRSSDKTSPGSSAAIPEAPVRGFAFLELHADSILTDRVRNRLKEILGSAAVERKTVLDLEMHHPGFLDRYFPDLGKLNRQLNYEGARRVRIEHNTIKLIFRYSTTFQYVELFFSNDTQKPLLFRIRAKRDGGDYLATLRQKYGEPQAVSWKDQKGKSVFWTMDKDMMILSLFADQYDQPQFEIMICHVENIENLLAAEHKESRRSEAEKAGAGRKLF